MMFFEKFYKGPRPQFTMDFWFLQLSVSTQNLFQSFEEDPKMYQPMPKGQSCKRSNNKGELLQSKYFLVVKGKGMKNQAFP